MSKSLLWKRDPDRDLAYFAHNQPLEGITKILVSNSQQHYHLLATSISLNNLGKCDKDSFKVPSQAMELS